VKRLARRKIFARPRGVLELLRSGRIMPPLPRRIRVMRRVIAVAFVCAAATPCLAQDLSPNFLKKEPYFLSPASVVFVDNGVCGVGRVLKVTGALGALRRKKICVPMGREEASRTVAIP
jgi:hypothetical protein